MNFEIIQKLLFVSTIISAFSCTFIQKTKVLLPKKKYLIQYSLIINIIFGSAFCYSFTNIKLPASLWVGLFSFIGADSIYKTFEGKISTYTSLRNRQKNL